MKILWDNYLESSTITASSVNNSYPVTNLYDTMLERKYMAETTNSTITVDFGENKAVSMIAYGFNNVAVGSADRVTITKGASTSYTITKDATDSLTIAVGIGYKLKNSSGVTLASGILNSGDCTNVTYLDSAITCRSVELSFSADETLYIGGLSIGDPVYYEYTTINPTFQKLLRADSTYTTGGQRLGKRKFSPRVWRVAIPNMTNDKRQDTIEMLDSVDIYKPFFCDLYDESDEEEAMYGTFTKAGTFQRDSYNRLYSTTMQIQEAR